MKNREVKQPPKKVVPASKAFDDQGTLPAKKIPAKKK